MPTVRNKKYSCSIRKKINEKYDGDKLIEYKTVDDRQPSLVNVDGALNISQWKEIKGDKGTITWSNLEDYKDYENIQKAVKEKIPKEYESDPLIWENKVWTLASGLI